LGRPPTISREAATSAALAIVDELGLGALSLEAVARRLAVRAPSLYNHFADRSDLLGDVARRVVAESPDGWPPKHPDDWRASLEERAVVVRRNVLAHPNAAPLLLQIPYREVYAEQGANWDRYLLESLTPEELVVVREGTEVFTYGSALLTASKRSHAPEPRSAAARRRRDDEDERLFRTALGTFLRGIGRA
jgi:AcrR family transcriptional regulator